MEYLSTVLVKLANGGRFLIRTAPGAITEYAVPLGDTYTTNKERGASSGEVAQIERALGSWLESFIDFFRGGK